MKVIPAIDLRNGNAVQLVGGVFGSEQVTISDVDTLADSFVAKGIARLHMIDLDAAKNVGNNFNLITKIAKKYNIEIEVGGGIRSVEKAKAYLDNGVDFVIVGTKAVEDPSFLKTLAAEVGKEHIIVCLDYKNGKVATQGWDVTIDATPIDLGKQMQDFCAGFLLTCIDKEGRMEGPDFEYIKQARNELSGEIIASGGISCDEDLKKLSDCGATGAVVGMALYKGKINLSLHV